MEVAFLDFAFLNCDLAIKCCGQSIDDPALNLRCSVVGVHHTSAVNGTDHFFNFHFTCLGQADFSNLGNNAAKTFLQSDAARAASLRRCVPASPTRSFSKHPLVPGFVAEIVQTELKRVALLLPGQFVCKRFQEKCVLGVRHTSPGAKWHVRRAFHIIDFLVGNLVGNMSCLGGFILADVGIFPRDQVPVAIEAGAETTGNRRSIVVVTGIFLAAPERLHWHVEVPGDLCCLDDGVG